KNAEKVVLSSLTLTRLCIKSLRAKYARYSHCVITTTTSTILNGIIYAQYSREKVVLSVRRRIYFPAIECVTQCARPRPGALRLRSSFKVNRICRGSASFRGFYMGI